MRLALALLVLSLTACGFHLRNDFALPPVMHDTFIQYAGSDGELMRAVARALNLSGVNVVQDPAAASAVLALDTAAVQRRVLLKDLTGRPREYEIAVNIAYRVLDPQGQVLFPAGSVTRQTNLVLDPSDPLASQGDIERAVQSLQEDAIWDMLRRIAVAEVRLPEETPAPEPETGPAAETP